MTTDHSGANYLNSGEETHGWGHEHIQMQLKLRGSNNDMKLIILEHWGKEGRRC